MRGTEGRTSTPGGRLTDGVIGGGGVSGCSASIGSITGGAGATRGGTGRRSTDGVGRNGGAAGATSAVSSTSNCSKRARN